MPGENLRKCRRASNLPDLECALQAASARFQRQLTLAREIRHSPFRRFAATIIRAPIRNDSEVKCMEGLSRWDFVLWFVVAYLAVMILIRMMLAHRDSVIRKVRDQLDLEQRSKARQPIPEKRRDAA
jgi:hypothetical protein